MTVDHSLQRFKMVESQIRPTDVTRADLVEAMLQVPREEFVGENLRSLAYIDEDLLIAPAAEGRPARYLMEPSPFAKLVQLAEVGPGDLVLDVGCGTGYSSAVLSRLAGSVIALEEDPVLAEQATRTLAALGYTSVAVVQRKLRDGFPSEAPYDVIFIGGAVDEVPATLLDQLKEGGRLVAVKGHGNAGIARLYLRAHGVVTSRRGFNAAVKPLSGFERPPSFVF